MSILVHNLNASRITPTYPHEGNCKSTLCPSCGCCGHCAEDGHCGGTLGCDEQGCGCFFELEAAHR